MQKKALLRENMIPKACIIDYGSWLLQNRLHDGRFKWPKGLEIGAKINRIQLEGLCKGLEVIESKKKKEDKEVEYY